MLQLKNLKLKSPVIQSPMAGCTDLAFRILARRRGMEFSFLEMISANGFVRNSEGSHELMKTLPEDRPLGAQLVGCDPDIVAEAAARIEDLGFDLLDLNLGCPVRKITAIGSGSALLKEPQKAKELFTKVVKAIKKIPVTVKMRKGFEDESGAEAVQIAKIAEDCGLSMVTVHGRTKAQGYSGFADWNAIRMVKEAVKIPVIGNGDVLTADDAKRMVDQTGCDGIMIGRGGLGNPWIYAAIRSKLYTGEPYHEPTLEDRRQTVLEHMELERLYEGEERAVFHMRRIGAWYIQGHHGAAQGRAELNRCQSIEQVGEVLRRTLSEPSPELSASAA